MVARHETRTADIELLGKLVTALSMGARASDDPVARLRFACGKLQEIPVEEFPVELQPAWCRILHDLQRHGPQFDYLPKDSASGLVVKLAFVMGRVETLAGL